MGARFRVLGKSSSSYSEGIAVSADQLVFISGQVALDNEGKVLDKDDLEGQTRRVFAKLEGLLREANASFEDVVRLTAYLTDMSRYSEYSRVRKEIFGPTYPASTAVEVKSLIVSGLLIEVDAIAVASGPTNGSPDGRNQEA